MVPPLDETLESIPFDPYHIVGVVLSYSSEFVMITSSPSELKLIGVPSYQFISFIIHSGMIVKYSPVTGSVSMMLEISAGFFFM